MMKRYLAFSIITRIFASVLLFWAALSHHPSGYYTLLRWVVFGVGAYSAYIAVTFNQISWAWCFGLIALLFNPLIPVWLNRATWINIDITAGVILILSIFFTLRRTKKSTAPQTGTAPEPSQRYASVSLPKGRPKKRVATSHVSGTPADFKTTPEVSKYSNLGRVKKGATAEQMQSSGKVSPYRERLAFIKSKFPRAYEKWTGEEDNRLLELHAKGLELSDISSDLRRQPSAINSRLRRIADGALQREEPMLRISPRILRTVRPRTVRFLPLAISSMQGDSICVAGVNVDKLEWIRTVRAGTYSMEKVHKDWFHVNQIHEIHLIKNQPRSRQSDPWGLHVEDWVIKDQPRLVGPISPPEKIALLQDLHDKDLKASLLDKRSLFLIEPTNFRVIPQEGKLPKIAFSVGYTNTDDLRDNHLLQASHIGISSLGCPCTCLRWPELVRQFGNISDESAIRKWGDDVKTYFTLSLAAAWRPPDLPEKKKKHYLLVAGIHVVGEERIWL